MSNKKQLTSVIIIVVLVLGTIGLLWWSNTPTVTQDDGTGAVKKERKLPASLLSDPRFQALKSSGGDVQVGTKGNSNPFEPFK